MIGPTIEDQAIVYSDIQSVDDLPIGWADKRDIPVGQRGDRLFSVMWSARHREKVSFSSKKIGHGHLTVGKGRKKGNGFRIERISLRQKIAFLGSFLRASRDRNTR